MKVYTAIPEGKYECPVCNGTGRVPATEEHKKYKSVIGGYDLVNDTILCQNCGGQTMSGRPQGYVAANKDSVACTHSYKGTNVGRCLTEYKCIWCNDRYQIDSGD